MVLIEWQACFAVGVPAVDDEHRALIDTINMLHARLESGAGVAEIAAVLGEIHAGIAAHFALEERFMRRAGWPEYAAHKADHEQLLDEIRDLMDDYAADPERGRARLRQELGDWFGMHFASFDARLHRAFGAAPLD